MTKRHQVGKHEAEMEKRVLDSKIYAYYAMAAGTLMVPSATDAAIVYSGLKNLSLSCNSTIPVDLDVNGTADFVFNNFVIHSTYSNYASVNLNFNTLNANMPNFIGFPFLLWPGQSIPGKIPIWFDANYFAGSSSLFYGLGNGGAPLSFGTSGQSCEVKLAAGYNFLTHGDSYIGIKFNIENAMHYGWIRYTPIKYRIVDQDNISMDPAMIVDWAYESEPDSSLRTGDNGSGIIHGGSITGQVTNAQGLAAEGICGKIYKHNIDYNEKTSQYPQGEFCAESNGAFTVEGVPDGTYKIFFYAPNFFSEWYNDKSDFSTADNITIASGTNVTNINAQMTAAGAVSGNVTDSSGNPLANIGVSVADTAGNSVAVGRTDANGFFKVGPLNTGKYKLSLSDSSTNFWGEWYNNKTDFSTSDNITVIAGSTTPNINVQLAASGKISGAVTDQSGNPIPKVMVYVYNSSGSQVGHKYNGTNGSYTLAGLVSDSYKIYFSDDTGSYFPEWYNDKLTSDSADSVAVTTGATTPNINVQLAPAGKITGTVTDGSGNPWGGAGVLIEVYNAVSGENVPVLGNYYTDYSNGTYAVGGLASGSYKIRFYTYGCTMGWYNAKPDMSSADTIAVVQGQTTEHIDAQFNPPVAGDEFADNCTSASVTALNSTVNGSINGCADYDYFQLQIPSEGTLTITKEAGGFYGYLYLKDTSCVDIRTRGNYFATEDQTFTYTLQPGTYNVAIRAYNPGDTGDYTLRFDFIPGPITTTTCPVLTTSTCPVEPATTSVITTTIATTSTLPTSTTSVFPSTTTTIGSAATTTTTAASTTTTIGSSTTTVASTTTTAQVVSTTTTTGAGGCIDNDGDGYGTNCAKGMDCNDSNPGMSPGLDEICDDNIDNNCNGLTDEDCDGKKCPFVNLLGEDNPRLADLQYFRDNTLVKNIIGRKIIQTYYNNVVSINAALDRSPALRALARKVLEVIAPMVGKKGK